MSSAHRELRQELRLKQEDDDGLGARPAAGPKGSPAPRERDASDTGAAADVTEAEAAPRLLLPRIRIEAFARDEALTAALQQAAVDRCAVKSDFSVHSGGFAEATERYRIHPPPDLVVIEAGGSAAALERQIEALGALCPAATRLVVVGDQNDIGLYRRMLARGVSDYLVQPVEPLALLDSLLTISAEQEDPRSLGLVLAFIGARGGVGSSTLAHNVAALLGGRFEATTLLIDADIGFGTAALQFDVASPHGLADAIKERENLDRDVLDKLVHWKDKRFGILIAPDRPEAILAPEPGVMRHVVDQARRLAQFVVLDLPQGWSSWSAEALAVADRVVLVATPDLPSLRNARTLIEMLRKLRPNDEPPHLVLNRMPTRGNPLISSEDFARILDHKVAAAIPHDPVAAAAEMAGRVLVEDAPDGSTGQAIAALAARMAGRDALAQPAGPRSGILGRLLAGGRR